jgi:hypothetical protein
MLAGDSSGAPLRLDTSDSLPPSADPLSPVLAYNLQDGSNALG